MPRPMRWIPLWGVMAQPACQCAARLSTAPGDAAPRDEACDMCAAADARTDGARADAAEGAPCAADGGIDCLAADEPPCEADGQGFVCPPGFTCCTIPWSLPEVGGWGSPRDVCVDLGDNPYACGACGRTCPFFARCVVGHCACPDGYTICGRRCVDLASDADHCGACGYACRAGAACEDAMCIRAGEEGSGPVHCGERRVDLTLDREHCGCCGGACPPGVACAGGECDEAPPACGGPHWPLMWWDGVDPAFNTGGCGADGIGCSGSVCAFARCGEWCPAGYARTPDDDSGRFYMPAGCVALGTHRIACGGGAWFCDNAVACDLDALCLCAGWDPPGEVCAAGKTGDGAPVYRCAYVAADTESCGDCGAACEAGESCVDGNCG